MLKNRPGTFVKKNEGVVARWLLQYAEYKCKWYSMFTGVEYPWEFRDMVSFVNMKSDVLLILKV